MYKLNDKQRDNILSFLNRTQIKGLNEVEAMIDIIIALSKKEEDKNGEQG